VQTLHAGADSHGRGDHALIKNEGVILLIALWALLVAGIIFLATGDTLTSALLAGGGGAATGAIIYGMFK
jgi:hypothetical protein